MTDGQQLLNEYAAHGTEAAFRKLVACYIDLVYSTAFRLVGGDAHLAQDVSQTVFLHLARKAGRISQGVMLGGWLHQATVNIATTLLRGERRRQIRERQAVQMSTLQNDSASYLERLGPVLDAAINQLSLADRTAIVLRFFERQDFHAVGQALGSTEDAARMRVNRALEKLHGLLRAQGVTLSTAALATGLATEAVTAAPAGLAGSIAGAALAGAAQAGTAVNMFKLMTMMKLKFSILGAVALAGVAAPLIVQHQSILKLREENQMLQQQQNQASQLIAENERLTNLLAETNPVRGDSSDQARELLRLRGEVGLLRQQSKALAQAQEENRQLRARSSPSAQLTGAPREALDAETAKNICISNLRQIDGASQQYALENKLSASDTVTAEQIQPYLKHPLETLHCPSGGAYTFGVLTNLPSCSTPGHAIPQSQ